MLILARRNGESIRINNNILLTVLSHNERQVKVVLETSKGRAVITRPLGSRLISTSDIHISSTRSHQGQLRLAFRAPRKVSIWREEIWQAMNRENHQHGKTQELQHEH